MADISRSEVSTLIQEEYGNDLLQAAIAASASLQLFRTVDMGTKTRNLPVVATLPEADFVSESATADAGVKPTSQMTWANKQLVAEEIAVIIPVHENVVDDATEDILGQIAAQGGAAIGRKLDGAVMFGVDKPASWVSDDLLAAAVAASQTITVGDVEDGEDLGGAIYHAAQFVDEAGFDPSGLAAPRGLRFRLPNIRNVDGTPIWAPSSDGTLDTVAGLTAAYVPGRVWDRTAAEAFVIDREAVVLGVRQDVTVKFLDQATVGGINLAERDMVALRFKARFAYVLGSGLTSEGDSEVPVAAILPAGS